MAARVCEEKSSPLLLLLLVTEGLECHVELPIGGGGSGRVERTWHARLEGRLCWRGAYVARLLKRQEWICPAAAAVLLFCCCRS